MVANDRRTLRKTPESLRISNNSIEARRNPVVPAAYETNPAVGLGSFGDLGCPRENATFPLKIVPVADESAAVASLAKAGLVCSLQATRSEGNVYLYGDECTSPVSSPAAKPKVAYCLPSTGDATYTLKDGTAVRKP